MRMGCLMRFKGLLSRFRVDRGEDSCEFVGV